MMPVARNGRYQLATYHGSLLALYHCHYGIVIGRCLSEKVEPEETGGSRRMPVVMHETLTHPEVVRISVISYLQLVGNLKDAAVVNFVKH